MYIGFSTPLHSMRNANGAWGIGLDSNDIVRINRISDNAILELVDELKEKFDDCTVSAQLPGKISIDLEKFRSNASNRQSYDIVSAGIQLGPNASHIKIDFFRGASKLGFDPQGRAQLRREPSIYFDELQFSADQKGAQANLVAGYLQTCLEIIDRHTTRAPVAKGGGDSSFDNAVQQEVAELRELYREMARGGQKREENQENAFLDRQRELEAEHQAKLLEVKERKDGLDQREQSLDDRGYMHVRRGLREQITEDLKERAGASLISKANRGGRTSVLLVALLFAMGAMGLAAWNYFILAFAIENGREGWELWLPAAKAAVSTFIFVAVGLTALTWMRRDYLDDVHRQHELERFSHDIDRASWIIETVMEMTRDKEGKIPDAWIEGVCKNLFESGTSMHSSSEGSSAIEQLFKFAGRAEFGPDGPKLTYERKDLRAVGKKISAANEKDAA